MNQSCQTLQIIRVHRLLDAADARVFQPPDDFKRFNCVPGHVGINAQGGLPAQNSPGSLCAPENIVFANLQFHVLEPVNPQFQKRDYELESNLC